MDQPWSRRLTATDQRIPLVVPESLGSPHDDELAEVDVAGEWKDLALDDTIRRVDDAEVVVVAHTEGEVFEQDEPLRLVVDVSARQQVGDEDLADGDDAVRATFGIRQLLERLPAEEFARWAVRWIAHVRGRWLDVDLVDLLHQRGCRRIAREVAVTLEDQERARPQGNDFTDTVARVVQ